jgi:hypothetical protein
MADEALIILLWRGGGGTGLGRHQAAALNEAGSPYASPAPSAVFGSHEPRNPRQRVGPSHAAMKMEEPPPRKGQRGFRENLYWPGAPPDQSQDSCSVRLLPSDFSE